MPGKIEKIFITTAAGEPMESVKSVTLEANKGIVGDRYHEHKGTYSKPSVIEPKRQLTLVTIEELDKFLAEHDLNLDHGDFRRNIVTSGIDLNALVGQEFEVDGVRCRGIETCEPCAYLAGMLSPLVLPHLVNKAGLRTEVLTTGEVKIGGAFTLGNSRE
ncbi:MAG: hypothetical protein QGG67_04415 [Gammaproteobacteria bacterium]|nr:hypothetical protein [Gammaproteobacteria bacterium]MDP6095224.1 hypothetical protein [Gammaproteobacteria bacterium]MDP7455391.1 hypothetical protein [Gammaproteobacteria bacterium]